MKIQTQHKKRQEAIDKLLNMMNYPGRFPILVLGDTGTGKSFWINEKINAVSDVKFKGKIKRVYAGLCENSQCFWENLLKEANGKFLLIEEVEKLDIISQDYLFDAMSTVDGFYGFEKKDLEIRIIFTSNFNIKKIRDDRRYLSAKFFDRISQFVVEFPNFDITQTYIYDDFRATWDKMFSTTDYKNKYPESKDFKKWLESIAYKMHGNFRDLDKIVINWNLHQVNGENKKEEEILEKVKKDFEKFLHNPFQKIYDDNTFVFDEDLDYGKMLIDFRCKLKKWALAFNENNKRNAAKQLNISHRTLERWG